MTKRERRIRRVRFLALLMAVGLFFVNGAEALATEYTIKQSTDTSSDLLSEIKLQRNMR